MKRIFAIVFFSLLSASCGLHAPAHWDGTPNPLDTPDVELTVPESMGDFGPGWMNRR